MNHRLLLLIFGVTYRLLLLESTGSASAQCRLKSQDRAGHESLMTLSRQ